MTRAALSAALGAAGGLVLAPLPVSGQRVQVGLTGASVHVVPEGQVSPGEYTGWVGGGEGRLAVGPVRLHVWYVQGGLTPSGGAAPRDLVEGAVLLGAEPAPWISVAVGPHIRSYLTPTGTQRWMFWEGRLRGDVGIIYGTLAAYLELSWIAGGNVTGVDAFGGGGGLEGGIAIRVPRTPIWLRGGYRVERATFGEVEGGETVERLMASVGVGLW